MRSAGADPVEAAYQRFMKQSAPLWLWLSLTLSLYAIPLIAELVVLLIDPKTNPYPSVQAAFNIVNDWIFPLVLLIFLVRGRAELRAILLGRLNLLWLVLVGVLGAVAALVFRELTDLVLFWDPHSWSLSSLFLVAKGDWRFDASTMLMDRVPRSGVRVTLDAGWFSARNDG